MLIRCRGFWQKNKELWENIQKSNWEDVILEQERKEAMIEDVIGFFDAEARYAEFNVPWKRGVIVRQNLLLFPLYFRSRRSRKLFGNFARAARPYLSMKAPFQLFGSCFGSSNVGANVY